MTNVFEAYKGMVKQMDHYVQNHHTLGLDAAVTGIMMASQEAKCRGVRRSLASKERNKRLIALSQQLIR